MNILLVRPCPDRRSINLQSFMICEPLELEYAAAYLQSLGHTVTLIDMILEKKSLPYFLKQESYDIVCFTAYINHVQIVKKYAASVRKYLPGAVTAVGGVHAEVVPEDFADSSIDYILRANGLETLGELARGLSKTEANALPGVYQVNKPRPEAAHPDRISPDRAITARYRDSYNYMYHEKCATIKTSYGCGYSCSFCFCTQICQYAVRDLDAVMDELMTIKEDNVFIVDDNFLTNTKRIRQFCEKLDERHINKKYIAFGRADFIVENPEIIALLAGHGLEALFVGLESFKEDDLHDLNKKTSVDQNIQAVRVLEYAGVQCYSGLIVSEDWRKSDFEALIRHLNSFEHPMVNIQPLTPMPGTPLYSDYQGDIILPRTQSERWDMAHIAFRPLYLSPRAYYYHILRAYFKTSASAKQRKYIKEQYGKDVYKRVRRGAAKITRQYIRLIIRP